MPAQLQTLTLVLTPHTNTDLTPPLTTPSSTSTLTDKHIRTTLILMYTHILFRVDVGLGMEQSLRHLRALGIVEGRSTVLHISVRVRGVRER